MIIREILKTHFQDSRVIFPVPLSITSHLMIIVDGECRFDDTLLYGYRSTFPRKWILAHYGESIGCPLYFRGYNCPQKRRTADTHHLIHMISLNFSTNY